MLVHVAQHTVEAQAARPLAASSHSYHELGNLAGLERFNRSGQEEQVLTWPKPCKECQVAGSLM